MSEFERECDEIFRTFETVCCLEFDKKEKVKQAYLQALQALKKLNYSERDLERYFCRKYVVKVDAYYQAMKIFMRQQCLYVSSMKLV